MDGTLLKGLEITFPAQFTDSKSDQRFRSYSTKTFEFLQLKKTTISKIDIKVPYYPPIAKTLSGKMDKVCRYLFP